MGAIAKAQTCSESLSHMFCCVLADALWTIQCQSPHVLTLVGVVCGRPWSGLAVASEPTALYKHRL